MYVSAYPLSYSSEPAKRDGNETFVILRQHFVKPIINDDYE